MICTFMIEHANLFGTPGSTSGQMTSIFFEDLGVAMTDRNTRQG